MPDNNDLARSARLFAALGIAPTADPASLRAAFASAARRHHPDKGGDAGAFAEVSAAYEELTKSATEAATAGGAAAATTGATATAATSVSSSSSSRSRHASAARTAAASLASGPPVAAELDLDECERFSEEEEEDEIEGEEDGGQERKKARKKKLFFYSHPCRCGGAFVVAESDLRADCSEAVVPCDGCSSRVRVLYRLAVDGFEEEEGKG